MVKEITIKSAEDLRQFMYLAMQTAEDVGVHTKNDEIADAKSVLGLMALDYSQPVKVVSEDAHFFKMLEKFEKERGL